MTEKISKVTVFCDDRRVGLVLRAVAGLVVGTPEVVPVINAEEKNGAVHASGNGTSLQMFVAHIKKRKLAEVNRAHAGDFLKSIGRSPGSASYLLQEGKKAGVLRKRGKGVHTSYVVTK